MSPRWLLSFALVPVVLGTSLAAQAQAGNAPGVVGHIHVGTTNPNQNTTPSATPASGASALAAADQLFAAHKLPEAAAKYQAIVKADPSSVRAQVGLIRSYMMMEKLDEAQAAAKAALAALPNSAKLLTTDGDLQFRLGKIPQAERAYVKSENLNPKDPEPYLGLARVYRAYSLYRRAYDNLKRAHEIAPTDLPVQLMWFHSLPPQSQIPALEAYLGSSSTDPQIARSLQPYLAALKKNAAAGSHDCKLVTRIAQTDTKLFPVQRSGMALGAVGLAVKINKQEVHLALDTGASGILLGRAAAERLGLQRLAYQPIIGMGDSGQQGGYTAVADRIRVGDLEFQDCEVKVTDAATPVTGQDGLIGSDVFSSYLIDIDVPSARLRLSQLPKRPNQAAEPASLNTVSQDQDSAAPAAGAADLPSDTYVAPDMANWTKVYRFRNLLTVPTLVDHTGPMLFLIDTGSFSNVLSTRAARDVTQIRSDPRTQVRGMSGSVAQVYRADQATLQFGRYEQQNQDIVTFDLSGISRQAGTEVSGVLGFAMLRILQIKIDYRDGLVDFVYDPHHLPKQVKIVN